MLHTIKVMLVEEDWEWQKKLTEDIHRTKDVEIVKIANTIEEAIKVAQKGSVDVVLMDIKNFTTTFQDLDTMRELAAHLRHKLKIIILSSSIDRDTVIRSFQGGAVNFLNKLEYQDFVKAIRDAYYDRSVIHADVAAIIREELKLLPLTPTEREVYLLMSSGFSKSQIACRLYKSENTIKTQIRSIRAKLLIV